MGPNGAPLSRGRGPSLSNRLTPALWRSACAGGGPRARFPPHLGRHWRYFSHAPPVHSGEDQRECQRPFRRTLVAVTRDPVPDPTSVEFVRIFPWINEPNLAIFDLGAIKIRHDREAIDVCRVTVARVLV